MYKFFLALLKLNWDFCFRKSKHTIKCSGCQKPITVVARPPRIDDHGPVGSAKCECGKEVVVSRYVHTTLGFGGPMPESVAVKRTKKIE